MDCTTCGKTNEAVNRFCIFCGTLLHGHAILDSSAGSELWLEPESDDDDAKKKLAALREQMRDVQVAVNNIEGRLSNIEREGQHISKAPIPRPTDQSDQGTSPRPGHSSTGKFLRDAHTWDWEQLFGGNWLALIGVIAVTIGVGFFLKLAFDNGWVGDEGRMALGVVGGLGLLGFGEYWRKRYPSYAQALVGGGIALLYLSIFAAFAIFDFIGFYQAVACLLAVSIGSASFAIRHDSLALAIIGIIGGFSAPFILDGFSETLTDPTSQAQYQILPYTIAVSIGVLILAMFRNWRWLTLLGLAAALACFGAWHNSYGEDASLLLSQGSLTIVFLVYVAATTVFHIARTQMPKTFDQILIVANGAMYFGISCSLLWDDHRPWVGAFSVALALFYSGIGYLIFRRSVENIALSFSSMGMALLFLTVTVPIQLGDSVWTTIVWAAEVPFLIWMSYTRNIPHLRVFAYGVSLILAGRLIFFDTGVDLESFNVLLNERVLAFVVAIAGWYLSAYLIGKNQHTQSHQPKWELKLVPARAFLIAANFFSLWLITAEVISGFDQHLMGGAQPNVEAIKDAKNLVITTVWAAYAGCLLAVGIVTRTRSIRLAGLGLLTIPIAKVFVYDVFMLSTTYRVAAFIGLGFLLLASGYAYQRFGNLIKGYLVDKSS